VVAEAVSNHLCIAVPEGRLGHWSPDGGFHTDFYQGPGRRQRGRHASVSAGHNALDIWPDCGVEGAHSTSWVFAELA
jgi:hypothetical protein